MRARDCSASASDAAAESAWADAEVSAALSSRASISTMGAPTLMTWPGRTRILRT
jgi:hypothetical protein